MCLSFGECATGCLTCFARATVRVCCAWSHLCAEERRMYHCYCTVMCTLLPVWRRVVGKINDHAKMELCGLMWIVMYRYWLLPIFWYIPWWWCHPIEAQVSEYIPHYTTPESAYITPEVLNMLTQEWYICRHSKNEVEKGYHAWPPSWTCTANDTAQPHC